MLLDRTSNIEANVQARFLKTVHGCHWQNVASNGTFFLLQNFNYSSQGNLEDSDHDCLLFNFWTSIRCGKILLSSHLEACLGRMIWIMTLMTKRWLHLDVGLEKLKRSTTDTGGTIIWCTLDIGGSWYLCTNASFGRNYI